MSGPSRNLGLYLHYQTARSAIAWLPVFFLYMSSTLSVDQAIVLESIYYAAVVALEVPSGYLSDRIGRRPTLVLAMMAWAAASIVFASTATFAAFVAAQVLMAAGMALNSGTDEALLYDSLTALDRTDEFVSIEARARARARLATGLAALVGGALAVFDLRLAYAISAAGGLTAMVIAWAMHEPHRGQAAPPITQLRVVVKRLADRRLAWLFAFAVAMTVFDHVGYMFIQPYLQLLDLPRISGEVSTPLVSGLVTAVTLVVAALASRAAPGVARRLGTAATLLGVLVVQGVVIGTMALVVAPWVVLVVLLRAVPPAIWQPVAHGIAHARVDSSFRATYFSVESLAGRLAFSASLAAAALAVGDLETIDAAALQYVLTGFLLTLLVTGAALLGCARALRA